MVHNMKLRRKLKRFISTSNLFWKLWAVLVAIGFSTASSGCGIDMRIIVDRPPNNLPAIEQRLTIGQSTADDVLALLGPPRGKGMAMLPIDPEKRVMWSYFYQDGVIDTASETADMRTLFLFVYFANDRYAGYFWFSNLPS